MPDSRSNPYSAPSPEPPRQADRFTGWRRHALGGIALALIVLGAFLLLGRVEVQGAEAMASFSLRVGFVLGALWLALPQLAAIFAKYPPWLIVGCVALMAAAVIQPKMLLYLLPIAGVLLLFKFLGIFTRPFNPGASRPPPRPEPPRANGPRDSHSNPESTAGKDG